MKERGFLGWTSTNQLILVTLSAVSLEQKKPSTPSLMFNQLSHHATDQVLHCLLYQQTFWITKFLLRTGLDKCLKFKNTNESEKLKNAYYQCEHEI